MKRILLLLITLLVALVFTGCKTEVAAEVKLSQLLDEKNYSQNADLYLEIPACSSYEDSRQPSSSLREAAELMPQVFSDAKLIDCFTRNFDSFAHFQIPIHILPEGEGSAVQDRNIQIIKRSSDNLLLGVQLPAGTKERMDRVRSQSMGATDMNLIFKIVVNNDINEAYEFVAGATYLNTTPVIFGDYTLRAGGSMTVMPADVVIDRALLGHAVDILFKTN